MMSWHRTQHRSCQNPSIYPNLFTWLHLDVKSQLLCSQHDTNQVPVNSKEHRPYRCFIQNVPIMFSSWCARVKNPECGNYDKDRTHRKSSSSSQKAKGRPKPQVPCFETGNLSKANYACCLACLKAQVPNIISTYFPWPWHRARGQSLLRDAVTL